MAVRTKAQLLASTTTLFPDNTQRLITPSRLRAMLTDMFDSMANTQGVAVGQLPYKTGDGTLGNSGAQILGDLSMLLPTGLGVEGASIDFGDITTLSEANSFLRLRNSQFPATRFDLIDARSRRTGPSSRPRQFYLNEAETTLVLQSDDSTALTNNPLTFQFAATGTREVSEAVVRLSAAMTNVRLRVAYSTTPNQVVKYWPSKASWLANEGRTLTPTGDDDEAMIDFSDSPFRVILGDVYTIEVRADNMTLMGNSSNAPYFALSKQDAEFRDLAWLSDITDVIDDTSIGTDKTRSAENIAQKNSDALKFSGRNGQTYNMSAGDIVAVVGGDTWQTGNVEHLDLIREKGAAAEFLLPVGILTADLAAGANAEQVVLHKGHARITIPGQDTLALDTPVYVTRTGSGNSEQWGFTHSSAGDNTFLVGHIHNDAGTNEYYAWIDFTLVWAHRSLGVDVEDNGAEVVASATTLNFVGAHHMVTMNGSEAEIEIDAGALLLPQFTGLTYEPGRPAAFIATAQGGAAVNIIPEPPGAPKQWPEFWAGRSIPNGSMGPWVQEGRIDNVELIATSATVPLLTPGDTFTNDHVFWDQPNNRFTLDTNAGWPRVGSIVAARYVLDRTTTFDSVLLAGSTGISTEGQANALRDATIQLPVLASAGTRTFQIPHRGGSQSYENAFQDGERFAVTNPLNTNMTFTINVATGGTLQDIGGTSVGSYVLAPGNCVVIEAQSGDIWRVVAEDLRVVEVDLIVSFDKMSSARDVALEARAEDHTGSLADIARVRQASFSGLDTFCNSNTAVVIKSGTCGSDDGSAMLTVGSDLTVNMPADLDTGTESANTWYYVWLFRQTSGSGVVARFSSSSTSPTVPSGYTAKRLVGVVRNDNNGHFRRFRAQGGGSSKVYSYNTEFLTLSSASFSSRTAVTVTSVVPSLPGVGYPLMSVTLEKTAGSNALVVYNADNSVSTAFLSGATTYGAVPHIQLNSSGQFHLGSSGSGVSGVYLKVRDFQLELPI